MQRPSGSVPERCRAAIDDPEQAAFRIAVADFFLQRKQSELVRQGVF